MNAPSFATATPTDRPQTCLSDTRLSLLAM